MYKEFNFCGIFFSPFFVRLVVSGAIYLLLHRIGDQLHLQDWVWNRPLFEAALFIVLLSAIVLYL